MERVVAPYTGKAMETLLSVIETIRFDDSLFAAVAEIGKDKFF
jgi:hypothetical protein